MKVGKILLGACTALGAMMLCSESIADSVPSVASTVYPAAPSPMNDQAPPSSVAPATTTVAPISAASAPQVAPTQTYTQEETLKAAQDFFGGTTQGLAKVIEKAFGEQGKPNAYITGGEGSGAVIVGLRYGSGTLSYKGGGNIKVFWTGPSVGWDFGGNASKVFMLVYNLHYTNDLFQRFPGVEGSLYLVAGVGLNYARAQGVTLAPIRTGVGLRAGASVGYVAFTRERTWIPF